MSEQKDRPFGKLAEGFQDAYKKLQPAKPGEAPSPGDRITDLQKTSGALAGFARDLLKGLEEILDWLYKAFEDLISLLEQVDSVVALGGLLVTIIDNSVEAGAAIVSLTKEVADKKEGDLFGDFKKYWPDVDGVYKKVESDGAMFLPPPEDVVAAREALAPLLAENPEGGGRSLKTLRAALGTG